MSPLVGGGTVRLALPGLSPHTLPVVRRRGDEREVVRDADEWPRVARQHDDVARSEDGVDGAALEPSSRKSVRLRNASALARRSALPEGERAYRALADALKPGA